MTGYGHGLVDAGDGGRMLAHVTIGRTSLRAKSRRLLGRDDVVPGMRATIQSPEARLLQRASVRHIDEGGAPGDFRRKCAAISRT